MAAPGPSAMASPDFEPLLEEDTEDLPRTFRREKEARAREARERAAQERAAASSWPLGTADRRLSPRPQTYSASEPDTDRDERPAAASVRRFDVPFSHLVAFFLKAVIAGIPALILLGAILWGMGAVLQALFPALIKMKILISFPN